MQRILVLPNADLVFTDTAGQAPFTIAETFRYADTANILVTAIGAIGLEFLDSGPLQSIEQLDIVGAGAIPDHVTQRRDEIVALQGRRLLFANFIAAALFGRIAALQHTSLSGALNVGMNDMLVYEQRGDALAVERTPYTNRVLGPKVAAMAAGRARTVPGTTLVAARQFTSALASRAAELSHVNLETCMAMNYQAAILHNAQHAPASFAINFSVAEALVTEVFHAYGLVGGQPPKSFATRPHSLAVLSNNAFNKLNLAGKLTALKDGGLISSYLEQRLQLARAQRNDLMHGALPVAVTDSGPLQTAVRDLWALLLDDPFELTAGYTMRW